MWGSIGVFFTCEVMGVGVILRPRLNLHHGSPRALLHPLIKDAVDCKNTLFILSIYQVYSL